MTMLGHMSVSDVYIAEPPTVYGEMTITQLDDKHNDRYNPEYVAMMKDGRSYLGLVTPSQVRKIRREGWHCVILNDISIQHIKAIEMDEPLYEVVEYMALHDLDPAAVVSEDEQQVHGAS